MELNSRGDFFYSIELIIIELFQRHTYQTWISFDELSLLLEAKYHLSLTMTVEDFQKSNYFRVYYGNSKYYALPLPSQNTQVNVPSTIEQKPQFFTPSRQVCKEIQSVEELITAISEIMQEPPSIKSINSSDLSDLSSQFYKIYRQPIRSVIKKILPDFTLRQIIEIIYLNNCEHNLD